MARLKYHLAAFYSWVALIFFGALFGFLQHFTLRQKTLRAELLEHVGGIAVVTGASSGIGLELVFHLSRCGIPTLALCRDNEGVYAARTAIQRRRDEVNANIECSDLDVTSAAAIASLVRTLKRRRQHIGLLINNAGT
jgi:NADP-dependent 3-hydroxy acid dehydrogenase YdfG